MSNVDKVIQTLLVQHDDDEAFFTAMAAIGHNSDSWAALLAMINTTTFPVRKHIELIFKLVDYVADQVQNGSDNFKKSKILLLVLVEGFKVTCDSQIYQKWIRKMKDLTKINSLYEGMNLHEPSALSLIALKAFLNFIERYTKLHDQSEPDPEIINQELVVVQNVIAHDPNFLIFPLAFVADHIMNIFTGPVSHPRKIEDVLKVLIC
jgi:hypothetical protein